MSSDHIQSPAEMDCEARYDYFLDCVVEERDIWILINENDEFLKIYGEDDDFEYLPVWPSAELAQAYDKDTDNQLKAISISLPDFFKKWVTGLEKDQLEVGVFPAVDGSVWVISPSELKQEIQDVLADMG